MTTAEILRQVVGTCPRDWRSFWAAVIKLRTVWLALLSFGFAGCESLADATTTVRDKISERAEPRTRIVAAAPRLAYEAVRSATAQMGYRFLRGGPAQGEFDAVTGVSAGEMGRSSRQFFIKVRLEGTLDGKGTELSVLITEIVEADPSNRVGQATEAPLRDTPQYEVFFRGVEQALTAAKPAPEGFQGPVVERVR